MEESINPLETFKEIPIHAIQLNPFQPRRHFAEVELEELAESIKSLGMIHPPTVRHLTSDTYELISGERRLRAAQLAGLERIPVIIKHSSVSHSAEAALVENIQRVDLNPIEIAKALQALKDQFGLQVDQLARRLGKKKAKLVIYLRLLGLPKGIQDSLFKGFITMGHAQAILSLEGIEKQNLLHELILRDGLSVKQAEEAALRITEKAKKQKLVYANRDFFLEQIAEKIQQRLGTKVTIQGKGKRGRIFIDYYNLDDLDRLLILLDVNN